MMLQKPFTVVEYTAPTKPSWGLTHGKEYAVETNTDFVDNEDTFVTVWNDEGFLAEMYDGEFKVISVDEAHWFRARPEKIYVEML